ncbi:hypothetical protein, partial [Proteus vulgaris]|uniref:hypothetical protein n=1 Tax=Proteus vulgaris TaxID=585 RepID=UPI0013D3C4C6
VRQLYEGLNILSGSDIRAWATAGEFLPLDKAAAKAAKVEASKAKALAKGADGREDAGEGAYRGRGVGQGRAVCRVAGEEQGCRGGALG